MSDQSASDVKTLCIDLEGFDFKTSELETFEPQPWEKVSRKKNNGLITRKRSLGLVIKVKTEIVEVAHSDYFGKYMKPGEKVFVIEGPMFLNWRTPPRVEIFACDRKESNIINAFMSTEVYEKEVRLFLWAIQSRTSWRSSTEFGEFYQNADRPPVECCDCGAKSQEIGLKSISGDPKWYFAFDLPGKFRCWKCQMKI